MDIRDIIYDRAFDASCMTRAGETEWADKILLRLKSTYPELSDNITQVYNGYLSLPFADYIEYRMNYMLEHRDTLRLRYK